MLIGIFGGSFNPIHKGHISIARQVLSLTALEEVWFMVTPQNPFKQNERLIDDNLRLEMTRKALENEPGLVCSDYEFHLPRPTYTWSTLQSLVRDFPNDTFALVIGADNWLSFPRWRNGDDILKHHEVIVYPRRGYPVDTRSLPAGVTYLDLQLLDISATMIREKIAEGEEIDEWTPPIVAEMMANDKSR